MENEEVLRKHKQERKELQSKIQTLKKSVPKGDKKKKREITEEIAKLEQEFEQKQTDELASLKSEQEIDIQQEDEEESTRRISRAQKRRNKKAQDEKDREKRIMEESEKNKTGTRVVEMNTIKEVLKKAGLQLYNIPADGNCLYCAVNHQLEITGRETFSVAKLRKLTAEFMRENKDDFMPFMYGDSEEPISEDYYSEYCKEVEKTKLWGGQLELKALSHVLTCPIKVIQASGPPTLQGENYTGPELTLTYHRHLYRLGEHYNSTVTTEHCSDNDEIVDDYE